MFPGSGLMDGFADFTTLGIDAVLMLGCYGDAIALQIAFLLARNHFIIGQVQQLRPKREGGSCHGSPSSVGALWRSPVSLTVHYTHNSMFSPSFAENPRTPAGAASGGQRRSRGSRCANGRAPSAGGSGAESRLRSRRC